ncbi:MAG: YheT family hydrolase, partial [Gammaproteobacteria bacterium]
RPVQARSPMLDVVRPSVLPAAAFQPHPLLRNPHLQTGVAALWRRPACSLRRERIEFDDGDFVDLGWRIPPRAADKLALLVHGLGGSLGSGYLCGMASALDARGWQVAMLQLRGAGPEPNRSLRCYHHGDTGDFRHVCRILRRRFPRAAIAAIGWSLGGSVVRRALGEDADASPLDAAIAISVPFDLRRSAERLRSGGGRVYQHLLLRQLRRNLRRKHAQVALPAAIDLRAALDAPDFFALGDAYIAPVNGFRDAQHYCDSAGCVPWLATIRRPALVVHAADDPFMDAAALPAPARLPPCARLELYAHGGHAGFIAADRLGRPALWLERRVPAFLAEVSAVPKGRTAPIPESVQASVLSATRYFGSSR